MSTMTMTVNELIEELNKYPRDTGVLLWNCTNSSDMQVIGVNDMRLLKSNGEEYSIIYISGEDVER